jgi:NAD(P)-dependent dehydrogenase (short-subunit alcohol dehydrogenase family)
VTGRGGAELRGKVVLVTGGATGIGLGAALAFARAGAAVAVNYSKNEAAAAKAVEEIGEAGGRAIAVQANVAREPEVTAMVARVATELGGLDILVNNAGWTSRSSPTGISRVSPTTSSTPCGPSTSRAPSTASGRRCRRWSGAAAARSST